MSKSSETNRLGRRVRLALAVLAGGARTLLDRAAEEAAAAPTGAAESATSEVPTLAEAFEEYFAANPKRKRSTEATYRSQMRYCLGDWLPRRLDTITRRDVEERFNRVSEQRGWAVGNHAIGLLRAAYRRPCVDHEHLRNPVELWLAGGGRYHRPVRRRIDTPAEVLPRWRRGIEAVVRSPATRDIFWFGMFTGMRRGEILALRWDSVDVETGVLRVEETKTGVPLELPVSRQLAAIFGRRRQTGARGGNPGVWVFPSKTSASGHIEELQHLYPRISREAGTKFWFHGLRNAFITVAERDLGLQPSVTKRLVNHARSDDVTENYAAAWTVQQLREPAQRVADRIEALALGGAGADG